MPSVPTHNLFFILSPKLSIAFFRPPLQRGLGSMCHASLRPARNKSGSVRRGEERECFRGMRGSDPCVVRDLREVGGEEALNSSMTLVTASSAASVDIRVSFENGFAPSCVGERAAGVGFRVCG